MSEKNPSDLGALWIKTSARGDYMTGVVNGQPVVCFKNDTKAEGSKQPDWRVMRPRAKADVAPATTTAPDDNEIIPF